MTELIHGDCLEVLRSMPDCSVDAVVTDPPYGLSFMGKKWDYDVPGVEVWAECLRVLKPGGHLLAFAGTRTQHRMAVRIEDAGFEIRDMIAWVYGSGFPKSLDVSKAIDKRGGAVADFAAFRDAVKASMLANKVTRSQLQTALGNFMLSHYLTAGSQPAIPTLADYRIIRDTVGIGTEWDALFNDEAEREVVGQKTAGLGSGKTYAFQDENGEAAKTLNITAPATDAAKQWQGWGTALKPALEPITVARKPLVGTVAENVLQHGTGAINVDEGRVEGGRWPANFIHDGSEEVVGLFPQSNGGAFPKKSNIPTGKHYDGGWGAVDNKERTEMGNGSAARFFYCAKASKADRDAGCEKLDAKKAGAMSGIETRDGKPTNHPMRTNHHPTVKPTDLMRYLCRLVTPSGGVVLDPFMGSGSTGKAAALEGFSFIGIEREAEYVAIAQARINHVTND